MFGIFKTKRILEVSGRFIPQYRSWFLDDWYAIDLTDGYKWRIMKHQLEYCSYGTLEEARNSVHKTRLEETRKSVRKIHKV